MGVNQNGFLALAATTRDLRAAARLLVLLGLAAPAIAACSSSSSVVDVPHVKRAAFTEKEFGVKASPRLSTAKNPPKGGGRQLVGKPYSVRGQTYTPLENPMGYQASGTASWYGNDFHGRQTANGEIFSATAISGASPVLPLPSYVRVTNLDNGRSMVVRVNDRGPYLHGRVMDLSYRAAEILGYANKGIGNIAVSYVGPAPLQGDDTRMLLASVDRPTQMEQGQTRFAMRDGGGSSTGQGGLLDNVISMFGYADTDAAAGATGAEAAAGALANGVLVPEPWGGDTDLADSAIRLELGVFSDTRQAEEVTLTFAALGAVDAELVRVADADATRLTLTRLKPGVTRADVMARVSQLGLSGAVLY